MICAWDAFMRLVPNCLRSDVDRLGKESLQELRLRIGLPVQLKCKDETITLTNTAKTEDIQHCINAASGYSPWSAATMANGYISAPGGHRIGVCGEAVIKNDSMTGIRTPSSVCIRVARDFPGIGKTIPLLHNSVLIIGRPGCGKTTLLRDFIRQYSDSQAGVIGVVDEREELFPTWKGSPCFYTGLSTDILSGCGKRHGIELLMRCMGPTAIAVDEITSSEDCNALIHAAWCGVSLFATAHAGSRKDLYSRTVYRPLVEQKIFDTLIIMRPDKSWTVERIGG